MQQSVLRAAPNNQIWCRGARAREIYFPELIALNLLPPTNLCSQVLPCKHVQPLSVSSRRREAVISICKRLMIDYWRKINKRAELVLKIQAKHPSNTKPYLEQPFTSRETCFNLLHFLSQDSPTTLINRSISLRVTSSYFFFLTCCSLLTCYLFFTFVVIEIRVTIIIISLRISSDR